MKSQHTVLLAQFEKSAQSRTYFDYESIGDMADGVVRLFERNLKKLSSPKGKLIYNVADLQKWVDGLTDLTCLTFDDKTSTYVPHDKEWIKKRVYTHLKKTVEQSNNKN